VPEQKQPVAWMTEYFNPQNIQYLLPVKIIARLVLDSQEEGGFQSFQVSGQALSNILYNNTLWYLVKF
jgi:hypothetical protein